MKTRALVAYLARVAIVVASLILFAHPARAALDANKADHDAEAAIAAGTFAFCTSPPDPLPAGGARACEIAREIPHCEALVARCTADADKGVDTALHPPKESHWSESVGPVADVVTWLLAIALAVAIAIPLARLVAARMRDRQLADPTPEIDDEPKPNVEAPIEISDADRLLARAEALSRAGEWRSAMTAYLEASLRALDRRGAIHLAPHRTNGEYVRTCNETAAKPLLREVVRSVDAVQFGGVTPTAEVVSRVASKASAIVAAVALAIALFVLGCGGGASGGGVGAHGGNDPLGDDLFRALMQRQDVTLTSAGALATLSLDDPRDSVPILLDAARVPLDERARKQLTAWVSGGGTLILFGSQTDLKSELEIDVTGASTTEIAATLPPEDAFLKGTNDDFAYDLSELEPFTATGRAMRPVAVEHDGGATLVRIGDARYAIAFSHDKGRVVFVAGDDLLTNVALARKGNASVLVTILLAAHANTLRLVRLEDGTSFADSPTTSLVRAGLGPALIQTLFAAFLLFLAFGVRATRPKPTPPPTRRAFTEHVRATGALWARAKIAPHALASYARWIEEQVRARAPSGTDAATWLAARSGTDPATCTALWDRAMRVRSKDAPEGDELLVLKRLGVLYSCAVEAKTSEKTARKRG